MEITCMVKIKKDKMKKIYLKVLIKNESNTII